jgi:hypothetical protein
MSIRKLRDKVIIPFFVSGAACRRSDGFVKAGSEAGDAHSRFRHKRSQSPGNRRADMRIERQDIMPILVMVALGFAMAWALTRAI